MSVKIDFNDQIDYKELRRQAQKVQDQYYYNMSQQILKDLNNSYVPRDTGDLIASSLIHSDFKSGKLKWRTPYALKVYYGTGINFSTDKNRGATALWDIQAQSEIGDKWTAQSQKIADKFFK